MKAAELPTRAQIEAIDDLEALGDLKDVVERTVIHIQAELDNFDSDDDWRKRATGALAAHQFVDRLLARRIAFLRSKKDSRRMPVRHEQDCDPLTAEAMRGAPEIDVEALATVLDCDRSSETLTTYVNALCSDREDEIGMGPRNRDEAFLAASSRRLAELRALRAKVQNRRSQITKAEKEARILAQDGRRERLFIDAARALLPVETYRLLWDRVDRDELEQGARPA